MIIESFYSVLSNAGKVQSVELSNLKKNIIKRFNHNSYSDMQDLIVKLILFYIHNILGVEDTGHFTTEQHLTNYCSYCFVRYLGRSFLLFSIVLHKLCPLHEERIQISYSTQLSYYTSLWWYRRGSNAHSNAVYCFLC